jgi:segregation and condensation protein A
MQFTISQPTFNGPIEMLLTMIEDRKMSISDVSLALVADQYLQHMAEMREYPLGSVTQFVWVASTLVLIKAKSLLPNVELTEDESADISILQERLNKLATVRKFSKYVEASWGSHPVFAAPGQLEHVVAFLPGRSVTVSEVARIATELIAHMNVESSEFEHDLQQVSVPVTIRLEEVMQKIRDTITRGSTGSFKSLTDGVVEKRSVIVTFLALLELARQAQLSLQQSGTFDDIQFSPYQMSEFNGGE